MKRLIFLCTAVLLMLTGCAGQEIPQETTPAEAEIPTEPVVETILIIPTTTPPEETVVPVSEEIDEDATPLSSMKYKAFQDRAVITDFTGKETEVIVTSHIGDYPVTEIGTHAFEASWDVTSVTLPDSVQVIAESAFADCESLTSLEIPENVTTIERAAFSGCTALTELTIPENVTSTQEEMLTATNLEDLYILNPDLDYNSWGLEDCEQKCTIHAPSGAKILDWAEENGFPTEELE